MVAEGIRDVFMGARVWTDCVPGYDMKRNRKWNTDALSDVYCGWLVSKKYRGAGDLGCGW